MNWKQQTNKQTHKQTSNNTTHLILLRSWLFSRCKVSFCSVWSSNSRWILRFVALIRETSSSASSNWRFKAFTLAFTLSTYQHKSTSVMKIKLLLIFITCSLDWSASLRSSSTCWRESFNFLSNLRHNFLASDRSLKKDEEIDLKKQEGSQRSRDLFTRMKITKSVNKQNRVERRC